MEKVRVVILARETEPYLLVRGPSMLENAQIVLRV